MTTTIAVATHKGGVGKTVTSMALGAAFARAYHKTLLVDLDPQGHCALGLGVELEESDCTIREFFQEPSTFPFRRVVHPTHVERLFIAPSTIRLAPISQALYMKTKREEILKKGLAPIRNQYEYIVVDCPPTLGVLSEAGISAADQIIIPCKMEARAADGLVDLLDVIFALKGDDFDNYRILITHYDSRKSVSNEAVMAQLSHWKERFFRTYIPLNEALNQSQMERTDIFTFDAKGKGALAYEALAKEILTDGTN